LRSYLNDSGELADYSIVFHMSYKNALEKSIDTLNDMSLSTDLERQARREVVASFENSLVKMASTPIEDIDDAYDRFFDEEGRYIKGVKLHRDTNTLHLYGLVSQKRVLIPGTYKKVNSKPLTIAKKKLTALTTCGKFRQFRITASKVDSIKVEKLELLPPE
jgi:hypothetical protein